MYAFGVRTYFGDVWLALDCIYICIGFYMPGLVFLKLLRCINVVSHWPAVATLIELMQNVGLCVRNVSGMVIVMMVLIFLYAILGKQLYVNAASLADEEINCHFQEFVPAVKCLSQIISGESYGRLVAQLVSEGYEELVALSYFLTFYVLLVFVCLNLLFVTVVDTFYLQRLGHDLLQADDLWGFTFAWSHLTLGTHAVPVLSTSRGHSFASRLRETILEVSHETEVGPVTYIVHDIPEQHADKGEIRRVFAQYGDIDDVVVRELRGIKGGGYFDAKVQYKDRQQVKADELQANEITIGDQVVTVKERRLAAQDLTALSVPNEVQTAMCTLQIRIVRAAGIKSDIQPFCRMTCLYTTASKTAMKHAQIAPSDRSQVDGSEMIADWLEDSVFDFHIDETVDAFTFDLHDTEDYADAKASTTVKLSDLRAMAVGQAAAKAGEGIAGNEATLDLVDPSGGDFCKLTIYLTVINKAHTPDWEFTSEFSADNANLKPPHCGVAGWVQHKDQKTGVFKPRWMYIMMSPPQFCMLDGVHTEYELRNQASRPRTSASGETHLTPDAVGIPAAHISKNRITAYTANEISSIRSGFTRVRNKARLSKQRFGDRRHHRAQQCNFEVAISDEHGLKDTGHDTIASRSIAESALGIIRVTIQKARSLPPMDDDGQTDAYVSCQYGDDDSDDLQLYRTDAVRGTCLPKFNEAFCFTVTNREQPLILTVCDEDPESVDEIIGRIEVDSLENLEEGDQEATWEPIKKVKLKVPHKISTAFLFPALCEAISPSTQYVRTIIGLCTLQGKLGELKFKVEWVGSEKCAKTVKMWEKEDQKAGRIKPLQIHCRFRAAGTHTPVNKLRFAVLQLPSAAACALNPDQPTIVCSDRCQIRVA